MAQSSATVSRLTARLSLLVVALAMFLLVDSGHARREEARRGEANGQAALRMASRLPAVEVSLVREGRS